VNHPGRDPGQPAGARSPLPFGQGRRDCLAPVQGADQ